METMKALKQALYNLVKMDYGFELYNADDNIIRLSFYHLNSCYNAFCTSVQQSEKWDKPETWWQYATENRSAQKQAEKIVSCLAQLKRAGKLEQGATVVFYYSDLSKKVFEAKYSMEVQLRTWGL